MPPPKKTPALLRAVVADYINTGNLAEAGRRNNLDPSLPTVWRRDPEWKEIESELIAEVASESKAAFHRNLNAGLLRIEERLEHGDMMVLKGGQTVNIPVKARDCALIVSMMFDKLRLIDGKATKITADQTKVQALLDEFRQMGQAYRTGSVLPGTSSVVEGDQDGPGSLADRVEGQNPSPPMRCNPPSPDSAPPPMPLLTQTSIPPPIDQRSGQRLERGRVRRKIQESADDPG